MPSFDSFIADGAENGFNTCLPSKNVLDRGDGNPYEYWTTLGGYNSDSSGNPTDAQIQSSLVNAMKIYWLLDSASIDIGAQVDSSGDLVDFDGDIHVDDEAGASVSPSPPYRVCPIGSTTFDEVDGNAGFFVELRNKIARYYMGSQFIGWGIHFTGPSVDTPENPGLQDTLYYSDSDTEYGQSNYDLGGTWDGRQPDDPTYQEDREHDIGFITLDGIPLLYWSSGVPINLPNEEDQYTITLGSGGASYSDDYGSSSTYVDGLSFWNAQ